MAKRTCIIDGCEKGREGRGLCSKHYQRLRRGYDLPALESKLERDPRPFVDANGYVRVSIGGGKTGYEHRVVWERHHGPIPDGYHVHHVNHDRADNRIENLALVHGAAHNRHHTQARHRSGELTRRGAAATGYLRELPDAELSRLADAGVSFREIGRRYGVGHHTVSNHVRRYRRGEGNT